MASLTLARPGRVSERLYLGDLARLFDRQRTRNGVGLTLDSFAADLAAHDSLRSGLFTLCTAISHMGENDLSPEELLNLVARAVSGTESDSGEAVPDAMRDAFLSGYESWRTRESQQFGDRLEAEPWPPEASCARKPLMRESAADFGLEGEIAGAGAEPAMPSVAPIASHTRKTVQEAISLVRRDSRNAEREDLSSPPQRPGTVPRPGDATAGSMSLGEIKHILEEIEDRVIRLGPHLQQLGAAAHQRLRGDRNLSRSPDAVIPFPPAHDASAKDEAGAQSGIDVEAVPCRHSDASEAPLAPTEEGYEHRPAGIDALLAAAPVWASATPTARSFSGDGPLARHAYPAPSRRPGGTAAAAAYFVEAPAYPLPQPIAAPTAGVLAAATEVPLRAPAAVSEAAIGLDVDDEPLLSPKDRLQTAMLRLSPRKVFLALVGLTVLAGGLAGIIAYRSLRTGSLHFSHFSDLESAARFADGPAATPPAAVVAAPETSAAPAASAADAQNSTTASRNARGPQNKAARIPLASSPEPPPTAGEGAAAAPDGGGPASQSNAAAEPLDVPAPTMIGYALASPQPVSPGGEAAGISGTVTVALIVSRRGDVISAQAVGGPPELRAAAVAAGRGWRFRPYLVDGRPTAVSTSLDFYFAGE